MIIINNRDPLDWKEGMTVQDVLDLMGFTYKLIMVTVNGQMVEDDEFEQFNIPDNADVKVIHIHHGG